MDIKALQQFLNSTPESYCGVISVIDYLNWWSDDSDIGWIDSKNDYYEAYLPEGLHSDSEHSIANLDTQQCITTVGIFDNNKRISQEVFEEFYEEVM